MSLPSSEYVIEIYSDGPVTTDTSLDDAIDVEVYTNTVSNIAAPDQQSVVEVASYPPVGGGYNRVETLPAFTRMGTLSVTSGGSSEYPIHGGQFELESIAARVTTPPTGSAVVLDVLKNNVSIFSTSANRPTVAAGQNNAVVGSFPRTVFDTGDFVEVLIVAVGSTTPGATLVVSVRLTRIG